MPVDLLLLLLMVASTPPTDADCSLRPSLVVEVGGLKDRSGLLRVEVYPANDDDFLADDTVLLAAGKVFRRVERPLPPDGSVVVCVPLPQPMRVALAVNHDRDANHRFGVTRDGVGFAGNPHLGWSKPRSAAASVTVGAGPVRTRVVMNYRCGLSMRPLTACGR